MADKKFSDYYADDEDFTIDPITLTDEDGVEHQFELVDTLEKNGITYVALITDPETPEEALESDGNLVIMKIVEEEGGQEVLELIEDDDEFEEISDIFKDRLGDIYDIEDDDDFDEDGDKD
ncbi:MAG: DUF1292 domain-containing protein [Oscillospiraceae bacterium]